MKILSLFFILFTMPLALSSTTPKPFTTDLCTGYPEGTRQQPTLWAHCCLKHDLDLWAGGRSDDRTQADLALRECVSKTGEPQHARLMWMGVRLGRLSPVKLPGQQWGNAWGNSVRNQILSREEINALHQALQFSSLSHDAIESFILELKQRNILLN